MAKNTDLDFDLDDGLDWPDLDSDNPTQNKSDGPIRKVALSFAKGARMRATDPMFLRRLATNSLPRGYGTAFEAFDSAKQGVEGLYDVAAAELKPAQASMRRLAKSALPKAEAVLPKKLADKIRGFAEAAEEASEQLSEEQQQQRAINAELAELFQEQIQQNAEGAEKDRTERLVRDRANALRFKDQMGALTAIARGVGRQANYNDQITSRYQRKNLELQYRQLHVQTSLLQHFRQHGEHTRLLLDAVVKNTALSEQEKLTISHRASGSFKDRLLNSMQSRSGKFLQNYGQKLTENIASRVKSGASAFAEAFSTADQMREMARDAGEFGTSGSELAGEAAGGGAIDMLGRILGRQVRKRIGTDGKIGQMGSRIHTLMTDLPALLNEYAKTTEDDSSLRGAVINALKGVLPTHSIDNKFRRNGLMDSSEPGTFNNLTQRSITQIIPRWLSEIHAELRRTRTGDASFKPLTFNLEKDDLTTERQLRKDIAGRLVDKDAAAFARSRANELVDSITDGRHLDPKVREALLRQLTHEAESAHTFNIDRFMSDDSEMRYLSGSDRSAVADLFRNRYVGQDGQIDRNSVEKSASLFRDYRGAIPDLGVALEAMSDVYGPKRLERLGYIVQKGRTREIDRNKIYNDLLFNQEEGELPEGPKAGNQFFDRMGKKADGWLDSKIDPYADKVEAWVANDPTAQAVKGFFNKWFGKASTAVGKQTESLKAKLKVAEQRINTSVNAQAKNLPDLSTGEYTDALTGDVIRRPDQITGPVLDADGNVVAATLSEAREIAKANGGSASDVNAGEFDKNAEKAAIVHPSIAKAIGLRDKIAGKVVEAKAKAVPKAEQARIKAQAIREKAQRAATLKVRELEVKAISALEAEIGSITDEHGRINISTEELIRRCETRAAEMGERDRKKLLGYFSKLTITTEPHLESLKASFADIKNDPKGFLSRMTDNVRTRVSGVTDSVTARATEMRESFQNRVDQLSEKLDSVRNQSDDQITRMETSPSEAMAAQSELTDLNRQQVTLLGQILDVILNRDFLVAGEQNEGFLKRWKGRAGMGWNAAKGLGKAWMGYAKAVYTLPWMAAKGIATGAKDLLSYGAEGVRDFFADIYVEGENQPALYAKGLRNGRYFDKASGKPVKGIRDIKGETVDDQGNVVLTQQEFERGIYYRRGGKMVKWAFGTAMNLGRAVLGGYASLFALPFKVIGWGAKKIGGLFSGGSANKAVDVYVKGERTPRLFAHRMRDGEYWRTKDRKVVRTPNDLAGEIKDREGNVVLSEADYDKGIVNQFGLPFNFLKRAAIGAVGKIVGGVVSGVSAGIGGVFRMGAAAANLAYGGIAGATNWLANKLKPDRKGLFTGWFGKGKSDPHLAALEKIFGVLDARLPAAKKSHKKGSWQAKAEALTEKKTEAEQKAKEESGTGGLLNFFKNLGNRGKSFMATLFGEDEEEGGGDGGGGNTIIAGGGGGNNDDDKDGKKKETPEERRNRRRQEAIRKSRRNGRLGLLFRAKDRVAGAGSSIANRFRRNGGSGASAGAARGAASAAAKPGILSRAGNMIGSPGKMAMGAAGYLGLDWLLDKGLGEDTGARDAANTAMNVGGTALTASWLSGLVGGPTLTSMAGGLLSGGSTLVGGAATTAGAVLGAPLAIGAAVVGAVGYVGYKGYKKYKWGTYIPLRAFRMAQYGFDYKDSTQGSMIAELEELCEAHVRRTGDGWEIGTGKDLTMEKVYEIFDLDDGWFSSNRQERVKFDLWLENRFKPIFLLWIANLREINSGVKLHDADSDLKPAEKKELLTGSNAANPAIYGVKAGPFDGEDVEITANGVRDAFLLASDDIQKQIDGKVTGNTLRRVGAAAMTSSNVIGIGEWASDKTEEYHQRQRMEQIQKDFTADGKSAEEEYRQRQIASTAAAAAGSAGVAAAASMGGSNWAHRWSTQGNTGMNSQAATEAISARADSGSAVNPVAVAAAGAAVGAAAATGRTHSSKAAAAAAYASKHANARSTGYCARFVANALQAAGYKFTRQGSAYLYASAGILEGMGFTQIPNGSQPMVGDVMVIDRFPGNRHGHIQIYDGQNWISDFRQRSDNPYRQRHPSTLWRDLSGGSTPGFLDRLGAAGQTIMDRATTAGSQVMSGDFAGAASTAINTPSAVIRSYSQGGRASLVTSGSGAEMERQVIQAARNAGITDRTELAMLLGQASAESGGFSRMEENLRYSPESAYRTWKSRFRSVEHAREVLAGGPQALAELVYGGRMGNRSSGDGYKYRGRGPIQLTGREMYENFSRWVGVDVVSNPDLLTTNKELAAKSVVWYWLTSVRGRAQINDLRSVTKAVNGGYHGLDTRRNAYNGYLTKLSAPGALNDIQAPPSTTDAAGAPEPPPPRMVAETGGLTTTSANGPMFQGVTASVSSASGTATSASPASADTAPSNSIGSTINLGNQGFSLTDAPTSAIPTVPSSASSGTSSDLTAPQVSAHTAAVASANASTREQESSISLGAKLDEMVRIGGLQLGALVEMSGYLKTMVGQGGNLADQLKIGNQQTKDAIVASSLAMSSSAGANSRPTETGRTSLPLSLKHT